MRPLPLALALMAGLALTSLPATGQERFDLLIRGGRVLDGTGNPWIQADIGIRGDRIVAVGALPGASAARVIEARGKVVLPGFIDIHSHADDGARSTGGLRDPSAQRRAGPNLVTQGITTVVVNQDGRSPWPIAQQRAELERGRIGPNAILLAGHGSVRQRAMGPDVRRAATVEEVGRMRELVRQAMGEGAWGLSAGLEYVPGRWSTTDEVVAVVEEIVPFNGVYISHERSEGSDPMWYWPSQDPPGPPTLLDAVSETIEIGERTGATVVASHIKAKGAHYWGTSAAVIRMIEEARARGVRVWADQYPYETTGSDGSTVLIPDWVYEGPRGSGEGRGAARDFAGALRRALADSGSARKVRQDVAHEIRRRGGPERVLILAYRDSTLAGKYLSEVAAAWQLPPVEAALQLQLRGWPDREGGVRLRGLSLSDYDIEPYAARPWVATATDGGIALPEDGFTHPRFYGTFPRKIRRYALERGALSVEAAVRSSTSLPATILGLKDRGLVHEGYYADVVVVDLERLQDRSTFFEPHVYSEGVDYVLVNGQLVVEQGKPTWALPGRVLTPGTQRRPATEDGP
ncbi:MAG TPA: amidohydrolase family protein [Gemmatimonadales bacterium]|nr:amidohydrolase family protein [Gemmatimonadales bacterium]